MKFELNTEFSLKALREIVSIPSPSGYCKTILDHIETLSSGFGFQLERDNKGNGIVTIDGEDNSCCVGVITHVDTLGFMVRSVNSDGTLRITSLGGSIYATVDGEYCTIHTRDGRTYTGTVLCNSPAAHVFPDAYTKERKEENMMVRIDERVSSKESVNALGIANGDYITLEPKFEATKSGFIKSRYLDDKAGVSCALSLMEIFSREGIRPAHRLKLIFSTYEEVGFGGASVPRDISELIAIDMGCVGSDMSATEYDVSICAKDSSGPYDYKMTSKLIELAKSNDLHYAVDIYPLYSSDATAALKGGSDIRAALFSPAVSASHGMERTHIESIENTIKLAMLYLLDQN